MVVVLMRGWFEGCAILRSFASHLAQASLSSGSRSHLLPVLYREVPVCGAQRESLIDTPCDSERLRVAHPCAHPRSTVLPVHKKKARPFGGLAKRRSIVKLPLECWLRDLGAVLSLRVCAEYLLRSQVSAVATWPGEHSARYVPMGQCPSAT